MSRKAGAFWVLVSQMEARHCYCSFHAIRPLTSTLSPERSDLMIYVIDVAAGEKIPCKDMVAFID
jgi:hypothetical protein